MSKCELCEKEKDSNYFHRSRFGLFFQVAGLIQILALHVINAAYVKLILLLIMSYICMCWFVVWVEVDLDVCVI